MCSCGNKSSSVLDSFIIANNISNNSNPSEGVVASSNNNITNTPNPMTIEDKVVNKLESIKDGWANTFFKNESVELLSAGRQSICNRCEYKSDFPYKRCQLCNCPIATKSRSQKESCPLGKWNANDKLVEIFKKMIS